MIHNQSIEHACLSCALLNESAALYLLENTSSEDYYFEKSKLLFNTFSELNKNKIKIDWITVKNHLELQGCFEKIGGAPWLLELSRDSAMSSNVQSYVDQLLECSAKRRTQEIAQKVIDDLKANKTTRSADIVSDIESQLKFIDRRVNNNMVPVDEILKGGISKLHYTPTDYVPTGFFHLDKMIMGLPNEELILIAARPSVGKSALMLNIARNITTENPAIIFSLEMPRVDLVTRLLSAESKITYRQIRSNTYSASDAAMLEEASERISKLKLLIDDSPKMRVENIIGKIKRVADKEKPRCVFIDYLSLITPTDRKLARHLQVGEITRALKGFARDFKIPVVLLVQLNRELEKRTNKRPILSDLKESGDCEQDADKVIFLYREKNDEPRTEVIIAKNRNGEIGYVDMYFENKFTKFI